MITEASASAARRDMAGSTSFAQLNGPLEPSNATTSDLALHHLRVPQQYISANYPIAHAAMSPDGVDIAIAGTKGLALYSRRSLKWRLFGDVSQERAFSVRVSTFPPTPPTPPPTDTQQSQKILGRYCHWFMRQAHKAP